MQNCMVQINGSKSSLLTYLTDIINKTIYFLRARPFVSMQTSAPCSIIKICQKEIGSTIPFNKKDVHKMVYNSKYARCIVIHNQQLDHINHANFVANLLYAIESTDIIQCIQRWRETTMQAEDLQKYRTIFSAFIRNTQKQNCKFTPMYNINIEQT